MVLSDCPELREISWRCVIIDEAHRLKNRNCKLLDSLKMLDLVSGPQSEQTWWSDMQTISHMTFPQCSQLLMIIFKWHSNPVFHPSRSSLSSYFLVSPVSSPRNTKYCWPALLSRTLWRNSSVCFIFWSQLSSLQRQSSSETLETSKQRNRCEIRTCWQIFTH